MKNLLFILVIVSMLLLACRNGGEEVNQEEINQEQGDQKETNQKQEDQKQEDQKQEDQKETNQKHFEAGTLITAVQNNDVAAVKEILKDNSYAIDETNGKEETPLLIATHNNYIEVAKLLIDAGADVNKQNAIQDSPYLYAGAEGKSEILTYIIEHAKPNQKIYNRFGGNALIPAAEKGHLENVKILLKDGKVDIDHQNNYEYTALIEAVALTDGSQVFQDIVKELLAHGANTELRDASNKTALDYAIELDYKEIASILKNHTK